MMPNWIGLLIIAAIVLFLFGGRGKISAIMGDMGKGINSFRKGLKDEGKDADADPADSAIDITPPKEKSKAKK